MSRIGCFPTFSIFLSCHQIYLTDPHRQPCQTPGMDLSKMTTSEAEALLRLLADMEREELELVMQERRGFDCYGAESQLAKDFRL